MRGSGRLLLGVLIGVALWLEMEVPAGAWAGGVRGATGTCVRATMEGEVRAGRGFERRFGGGLRVVLEPRATGWVLRVLPVGEGRGGHDFAELATPPYESVNPLLIGTEYGFRAQDAVGWNPRRFRFARNPEEFSAMLAAYVSYRQKRAGAEGELARLVSLAPEGELQIVDARLVPGSGDQAPAAGAVASHFGTTAHTLETARDGQGSKLGEITWMRFRIVLEVPAGFRVRPEAATRRVPCRRS